MTEHPSSHADQRHTKHPPSRPLHPPYAATHPRFRLRHARDRADCGQHRHYHDQTCRGRLPSYFRIAAEQPHAQSPSVNHGAETPHFLQRHPIVEFGRCSAHQLDTGQRRTRAGEAGELFQTAAEQPHTKSPPIITGRTHHTPFSGNPRSISDAARVQTTTDEGGQPHTSSQ